MAEVRENNCFAYREIKCTALDRIQPGCGTVKCPFYKRKSHYVRHEEDGKVYFTDRGKRVEP